MKPSTKTVLPTPPLTPAHRGRISTGTMWSRLACESHTLS